MNTWTMVAICILIFSLAVIVFSSYNNDSPLLKRGWRCVVCGRHYDDITVHTTWYEPGQGSFVMCEDDWNNLTIEERIPYYQKRLSQTGSGWTPEKIEKVIQTVKDGG